MMNLPQEVIYIYELTLTCWDKQRYSSSARHIFFNSCTVNMCIRDSADFSSLHDFNRTYLLKFTEFLQCPQSHTFRGFLNIYVITCALLQFLCNVIMYLYRILLHINATGQRSMNE